MALKTDTKFEGKLTCTSKNDMKNFANFHQSTFESLKKVLSSKIQNELTIYRGVMCHENKE